MTEGGTATVNVSSYFRDPDGDALTYSAATSNAAVAGVSVSGSTMTIAGVAPGTASVTVTARDPGGLEAAQSVGVTVQRANRAPVTAGAIPSQTVTEGGTATVNVSSYFRDPDGDALTYSAATSNAAVAGVSVSGSTMTIAGVAPGTASVTVTARDPGGLEAAQSVGVTVQSGNRAPVARGQIPSQTVTEGGTATVNVSSYFRDPDGDALTYSAATSNAAVAGVSVSGSTMTIAGVAPGTASVTVTARDPGGLEAAQSVGVTVQRANRAPVTAGAIPSQTVTEGGTATVNVSSYFRDPDGDALTYSAATSNAAVAGVSVSGSTMTIAGVAPGTASVTVTARDPGGLEAAQSVGVTVQRANRAPVTAGAIPSQTVTEGGTATVNVSSYFRDPDGDALTYSAATSNAAVAGVSVSGSTMTIAGVAPGTASVTVTARDPGGLEAAQSASVTVAQGSPVAVGTIPPLTLTEGKTERVRVDPFFRDPDGDHLVYSAESSDANVASASITVSPSWMAIVGVAPGTATVTVTARDPGGLTATQSMSVTVQANQAPVVVATIPAQNMTSGEMVTLNASEYFIDPDGDPLTYEAESSNSGLVTVSVSRSTITVNAVAVGNATVTVSARDPLQLKAEQSFTVTAMPHPDRAALEALYRATGGPAWIVRSNWLTDRPLREWFGVTVDADGRVAELRLNCKNLRGFIPPELGNLSGLRHIDFAAGIPRTGSCPSYDYGFIRGIPNELTGPIPSELGNLSSLSYLDLSLNALTGPIPSELGNLSSLSYLNLRRNDLTGSIPSELGNLSSLSGLNLAANDLTGSIPSELGDLSSLSRLNLDDNALTGPIPSELGNLSSLSDLDLSDNALTGPIPSELGNLSSLSRLNLDDNALTGPIPSELGNLSSLSDLDLAFNALTGPIPPELGNLSNLSTLFLWYNRLEGPIPPELGNLTNLLILYLSHNQLTGTIPQTFLQLRRLTAFSIAGNEGLCFPSADNFTAWLANIKSHDTIRLCQGTN